MILFFLILFKNLRKQKFRCQPSELVDRRLLHLKENTFKIQTGFDKLSLTFNYMNLKY
jgi:hypothetical protein